MIFVTVGTSDLPFDRLVEVCDELAAREPTIVQRGCSGVAVRRAGCVDYVSFELLVAYVQAARAVVTHAGAGSILVALRAGKRAYAVPRLRRLGEAVDDHQVGLAAELERGGLITVVSDPRDLPQAIAAYPPTLDVAAAPSRLVDDLKDYLAGEILTRRPPSPVLASAAARRPPKTG